MNPGEVIFFMMLAGIAFVLFVIFAFIFRKRKKVVIGFAVVLLVSYVGYYVYFPVQKEKRRYKSVRL